MADVDDDVEKEVAISSVGSSASGTRSNITTTISSVPTSQSLGDIDEDTVMIKNTEISIPTLKRVFSHALSNLEESLFKDLMFISENGHDGIIPTNLSSIVDDKHNTEPLQDMTSISNLKTMRNSLTKRTRDKNTSLYAFFTKSTLTLSTLTLLWQPNHMTSLSGRVYSRPPSSLVCKTLLFLHTHNSQTLHKHTTNTQQTHNKHTTNTQHGTQGQQEDQTQ